MVRSGIPLLMFFICGLVLNDTFQERDFRINQYGSVSEVSENIRKNRGFVKYEKQTQFHVHIYATESL